MWRRCFNFWNIFLLVSNCVILMAIIQVWWGQEKTPTPQRSNHEIQTPLAPLLKDHQGLGSFKVVTAKNLFSEDRTGPDGTEGNGNGQNNFEGRQLVGVIIIGDQRAALIGGTGPGPGKNPTEIEVVRLGEEWSGLKITEISQENVTFQGKGGQKTLGFPE